MSPRRKQKSSRPRRRIVRSKDMVIKVRSEPKTPPDYKRLARAILLVAKDMQRERDAKKD